LIVCFVFCGYVALDLNDRLEAIQNQIIPIYEVDEIRRNLTRIEEEIVAIENQLQEFDN